MKRGDFSGTFAVMVASYGERAKSTHYGRILRRATLKPFLVMPRSPTSRRGGSVASYRSRTRLDKLRTALRCDDPILFLEHKEAVSRAVQPVAASGGGLYDSVRSAKVVKPGQNHSVITYGVFGAESAAGGDAARSGGEHRGSGSAHACAL